MSVEDLGVKLQLLQETAQVKISKQKSVVRLQTPGRSGLRVHRSSAPQGLHHIGQLARAYPQRHHSGDPRRSVNINRASNSLAVHPTSLTGVTRLKARAHDVATESTMTAQSKPIPALYVVYILRSTVRHASLYIGSTPHPPRRLNQHNGKAKGGAVRTSRDSLRPWEIVGVVSGFPSMVGALKFEYALSNPLPFPIPA